MTSSVLFKKAPCPGVPDPRFRLRSYTSRRAAAAIWHFSRGASPSQRQLSPRMTYDSHLTPCQRTVRLLSTRSSQVLSKILGHINPLHSRGFGLSDTPACSLLVLKIIGCLLVKASPLLTTISKETVAGTTTACYPTFCLILSLPKTLNSG